MTINQRELFAETAERQQGLLGARFSSCGRYRDLLWHIWGEPGGVLGFIGCNPSIADGVRWDPTARKFEGFARRLGASGWRAANLFPMVATDPDALALYASRTMTAPRALGPRADAAICELVKSSDRVIVCWGATGGVYEHRVSAVLELLGATPLWCLGTTADGHPRHPSRLSYDTPLQRWR